MKEIVEPTCEKILHSVNIIGSRSGEPHWLGDLEEIKRILEHHGVKISTVISWCSVDDLRRISRAEVNVVLGGDGIQLAEQLKKYLDMPYIVVPYPFGVSNTVKFIESVCKAVGVDVYYDFIGREEKSIHEVLEHFYTHIDGLYGSASCIVMSESSRVFSLAHFLKSELGLAIDLVVVRCRNVLTASEISKITCEVMIEPDKFELERKIMELEPDLIYASSFERDIAIKAGAALLLECHIQHLTRLT